MIADLLPQYYRVFGTNPSYTIVRSFLVYGHEVAWMKFEGMRVDNTAYQGYELQCECDFSKDIGWGVENGKAYTLDHPRRCAYRKEALRRRHQELRQEYIQRFHGLPIREIIFDLIEKAKAEEFLEDGGGANFWGGYFYLDTVVDIVEQPLPNLWSEIKHLVAERKISLEGHVVQPYRKPPRPMWVKCFTIKKNGWIGIALLPQHSHMAQEWKLRVLKPDGTAAFSKPQKLPMLHAPIFGPDINDVSSAKDRLRKLIRKAMKRT